MSTTLRGQMHQDKVDMILTAASRVLCRWEPIAPFANANRKPMRDPRERLTRADAGLLPGTRTGLQTRPQARQEPVERRVRPFCDDELATLRELKDRVGDAISRHHARPPKRGLYQAVSSLTLPAAVSPTHQIDPSAATNANPFVLTAA
jgi:hypothetical protein